MTDYEKVLIEQCAPTLAGIKPASLFRLCGGSLCSIQESICQWDKQFRPLGIHSVVLKVCLKNLSYLVMIYREQWLRNIVAEEATWRFLSGLGYEQQELCYLFQRLSQRFCLESNCPHEVGIFLGYPLEDVLGFIAHKGHNFTCCGYWKCYGDPAAAQKCFDRYRKCTDLYKKRYQSGIPIIQLVVAA